MQWEPYRQPPRGIGAGHVAMGFVLVLVAIAWAWVMMSVLTRALPAVLPGQDAYVPGLTETLESLPEPARIERPGPDHIFNRPITILLMGADRRPGQSDLEVRTDSILVLRLDPATNRASAISIPRDLWVDIHTADGATYPERINTSYAAGAIAGGSVEAGAEQLLRDLEANFGITADHWMWLDIAGAAAVIDALGGVEIDVPAELAVPEWLYTDDDVTNPHYVAFPPGKYEVSGYDAVAFSRYRNDSDLFRVQRQQVVLEGVLDRLLSWHVASNPAELYDASSTAIQTDIPVGRLPGIAFLGSRAAGNLSAYSLGQDVDGVPTVYPMVTDSGASVLTWDAANVAQIWALAQATR